MTTMKKGDQRRIWTPGLIRTAGLLSLAMAFWITILVYAIHENNAIERKAADRADGADAIEKRVSKLESQLALLMKRFGPITSPTTTTKPAEEQS